MTDFDYQWKNLLGKEALKDMEQMFECNNDRVKEFLKLTGIKSLYSKDFAIGKYRFDNDGKELEFHYGGQAYITGAVPEIVASEVKVLALYGLILMTLILFINLKNFQSVLLILTIISLSLLSLS